MKGELAFYVHDTRIAATSKALSAEEVTLRLIAKRFFVRDRVGGIWLAYDQATGRGYWLLLSARSNPARRPRGKCVSLDSRSAWAVDPALVEATRDFGVSALQWNGTRAVAAGQ